MRIYWTDIDIELTLIIEPARSLEFDCNLAVIASPDFMVSRLTTGLLSYS